MDSVTGVSIIRVKHPLGVNRGGLTQRTNCNPRAGSNCGDPLATYPFCARTFSATSDPQVSPNLDF